MQSPPEKDSHLIQAMLLSLAHFLKGLRILDNSVMFSDGEQHSNDKWQPDDERAHHSRAEPKYWVSLFILPVP